MGNRGIQFLILGDRGTKQNDFGEETILFHGDKETKAYFHGEQGNRYPWEGLPF